MPVVRTQISTVEMNDIFQNFFINWHTLSPVLNILLGVLFAFMLLGLLIKKFKDD